MEFLRLVLLFLHVLGFAALLGGLLVQLRDPEKKVLPIVTGLLLVGVLEGLGSPDHVKVAVKLVVGLVLLVLVMANMRKPRIPGGLYWGLLALTVLNIGVAVFSSTVHA